jgi:hypothetical protein
LGLIVLETVVLTALAIGLSCLIKIVIEMAFGPWLQIKFGLYLQDPIFATSEIVYIFIMMGLSIAISFIPAFRAMKSALKDGLSLKI